MPRPRKARRIGAMPVVTVFKPQGVPLMTLRSVVLSVDGLEAIRLADVEGLDHDAAARCMNVSRPTFTRLLSEAHQVVGQALVQGLALEIDGGAVELVPPGACPAVAEGCPRRQRRCLKPNPEPGAADDGSADTGD